jgi:hypothetical protein
MRGLERRLKVLEDGSALDPFPNMTDEQLAERWVELRAAIEAHGVTFPTDWDEMSWPQQSAWIEQLNMEAACRGH